MASILVCAAALGLSAQENAVAKQPPPTQAAGLITAVTIEPSHVILAPGESEQFTATVAGTGAFSSQLKWSVNGIDGGNVSLGTVSSSGMYVTPYPTPAVVTLKATSTADPTQSASATITLAAPPVAPGPALQVDASAVARPISPLIYGMNSWRLSDPKHEAPKVAEAVRLPLDRWGGDGYTLYNYKLDVSNLGDDWFFEIAPNANTKYPDESEFNSQVIGDRTVGAKTLLSVPVIGWVAKSRTRGSSFSVAKYGPQQKADPNWPDFGNGIKPDGTKIANDPNDTCMPIDESWTSDWVKYLVGRFGNAANGGVAIYALDNEPTWWDKMHRDVHPLPFSYDEITDKGLKVAKAIKTADPTAEVSGPVIDLWITYFYSKKDIEWFQDHWPNVSGGPVDRVAHGNVPLIDYYLRAFKAAQEADPQHTRFLDYLDLHTYFAANDAMLKPAGTSVQQRAVIDSTRVFWDPTYTDPHFRNPENYAEPLAPQMIPRMKNWVAADYPGTKTAITEYNWGAPEHISGAVAQADILGIFGREGLDLGALWGPPDLNQPLMFAFKIFRNYDDYGSGFGDTSLRASSVDQGKLAIYAARRAADRAVTVVVINKTFGDLRTDIEIHHFKAKRKATVYRYSDADLTVIHALPDVKASRSGGNDKASVVRGQLFPAMSITLYAIQGK
ncbi:MAG: glycoside hydrolase family 44 protein [Terracidiphilus sp.]